MNLTTVWVGIALLPGVCFVYAYLVYPVLLRLVGWFRAPEPVRADPAEWPLVSFSVPAYNEAAAIRRTIESLLALDYPPERRQIVVVSDASTDGTDDIVREYADRGVELCRLSRRSGKTAAENAAIGYLKGPIVVNTDATIRILPGSLKPLIRAFQDPTVGVASGRDVSVGDLTTGANRGESGYVGYEMWVRSLETRVGSIVGASGCFYAIRRDLHEALVPEALSRDFASALTAREHGLRAVSVNEAVCLVPRTVSLRREFHRKVRTMTRGLETLWFKRRLLNPFRYGWFAWMLFSHKLARWLVFLFIPPALAALVLLTPQSGAARVVLGLAAATLVAGTLAVRWPARRATPRLLELAGFVLVACLAGFLAWLRALRGDLNPIWEPTRRPA
ncbi:MAG TPA: glycosyltransferase [Gemmatimonadales bacterium]|nr:glycosyltransferase [Gemmatimonadales bacterium]